MLNDKDYAQKICCVGLIPAYKPDKKLISTIKGCLSRSFLQKIVIVDDGSGNDFTALFEDIKQISNCIVLHLAINSGMGGGNQIWHTVYFV